ncbi:RNA polymerase II-associated protein 1 isoform X2 [Macrosteles quadrilineatus]|uniref:RNA polymerase II-associated protein 1 isoform X2 n=1 Tax=Macrosteles quadrilineatus TaxID=74068 RepID=UPI0023E1C677|nr:RNA polymerase II-associated protein 1 isoform X2 [Macrosteles quadrilineatus]
MTPAEIEEERNNLLANIDPSLVEFLKSRKSLQATQRIKRESQNQPSNSHAMDESEVVRQTAAAELVNKFPHMDVVEPEKLKWMENVPPSKPPPSGCPYNARFNFDGELLPYCEEQTTEGLHHHGDEPERPGYTLQELMQLSRSSMLQQRITAISTLSNIFVKASDYDYCLEKPLLPQLLDSELYLLLRFTLDDSVRSVVSAALAAISNLLVNIKDEGCLDRLLGLATGLRQPSLFVQLDLKPTELAELKDTELLKVDVIKGALRTHLLPRFRYIMDKLNPEPVEIGHISRCLVRIARHSPEAATEICNSPGLLGAVRRFLEEGPPRACSEALKLFRVISSQSQSLATHLFETYNLMDVIQRFIAGSRDETSMSLVLESFYTWQSFLAYHLAVGCVGPFTSVIQRLLVTHADNTNIGDSSGGDLEHATAVVSWVTAVLRVDISSVSCLLPTLHLCTLKWLSQAAHASGFKWAGCKLLESVLNAVALNVKLQDFKSNEIHQKVESFLSSENFVLLSQQLRKCSWLLEGEKSPSVVESLPCLGSISPTLYDHSPLPVMMGLAVYVYAIRSPQLSEKFATTEGIQKYLEEVVTGGVRTTTSHWFARQEIVLLYTLLQIHLNTQNPVEGSLVHQAALFLSTSIHADDRYMLSDLFTQVIFNKHFFGADINDISTQLEGLHLNSDAQNVPDKKTKLLTEALDSLETICGCYQREFALEGLGHISPPPSLTASPRGTESALPADWLYLPLVHLNNIDGKRGDALSVATSCLQWCVVLECLRPDFLSHLPPASRFCRLACVLLAGNDLFRDVRDWLNEALQALLVHDKQMKFNKPIPGLQSFYDFYRQILEQFVGVSYGDVVFGQFVLIPLQQRHDIRLKKLVWCELGAVLRFLSTPTDQVGVPIKNFLEPCETDADLLHIYLRSIAQGRVRQTFCPVLFKVAVHHVATFISLYPDEGPARKLKQMVDALGNQELKNLLQNYNSEQNQSRMDE